MENIPVTELAKRVVFRKKPTGELAFAFMRGHSHPAIPPSLNDCFLIVPVEKRCLGEIYIALKELVEKEPEQCGFEMVK